MVSGRLGRGVRLALSFSLLLLGCTEPELAPARLSLLAIGDAGAPPTNATDYPRMLAVTRAMANADRERPVDAVVLLGDNFYPGGLEEHALVPRVAANVAAPFCRFLVTSAPRFAEVAASCTLADDDRHPVPLFAILGNHDYDAPLSAHLQRHRVAEFVENWKMPVGMAGLHEFDAGVSLVLFDSELVAAGQTTRVLVEALRRSRGPWRIVVAHRPMATREAAVSVPGRGSYADHVRQAIREAGVPVALFAAGHEHRLALLEGDPRAASLHLVSGAGSDRRRNREVEPNTLEDFSALGFARIDLIGHDLDARLVVSLYGVHRYAWVRALRERRLLARFSVDLSGGIHRD